MKPISARDLRALAGRPVWTTGSSPEPPRAASRSTSLPSKQATGLINGLGYAETLLPADTPWAHIIAVLDQSEHCVDAPRDYLALQGRVLHAVKRWLREKQLPAHYLWCREIGPRYGMAHTHILVPLSPDLAPALADLIYRVGRLHDVPGNRAVVIRTNGSRGINTPASRAGVLRDFLKTMSPKAKQANSPIMPALGVDNRGQKPCTIFGKRTGTSESLSQKARANAGWRELTSLPALRAALPTGKEAKRERNRVYQRRQREARKAAPTLPPQPSMPSCLPKPDSFGMEELAADFFEPA